MILAMKSPVAVDVPYRGRLFDVHVVHLRLADGRPLEREIIRHPGAVLVLPVLETAESDVRVVMIRNERIAVGRRLWELPAGKLEPGEDPADAAARELEEETGYRAREIRKLGEFYTSPGFTDELMRVYVAEGLTFAGQRLEAGEDIEVVPVPVEESLEMAIDGRLIDGKTIAALLMWNHTRERKSMAGSCMA